MVFALEDEFGDIIAKARSGKGLSAEDVARPSGVAVGDLGAMEAYERIPSRDECRRIAQVLDLEPETLWAAATESWVPQPVVPGLAGGIQVLLLPHPPMRVAMYVIGQPSSRQALVVDPGAEPERILGVLRSAGWRAVGILVTHGHGDHIGALAELYRELRVPVWVHAEERASLRAVDARDVRALEGETEFAAGPFELRALPTPGHSSGHTAYQLRNGVMVGDALFAGSVGRANLGPVFYASQLSAVRERILSLPADTKLFPGHGPPTTVGEERAHNPFFAAHCRP